MNCFKELAPHDLETSIETIGGVVHSRAREHYPIEDLAPVVASVGMEDLMLSGPFCLSGAGGKGYIEDQIVVLEPRPVSGHTKHGSRDGSTQTEKEGDAVQSAQGSSQDETLVNSRAANSLGKCPCKTAMIKGGKDCV